MILKASTVITGDGETVIKSGGVSVDNGIITGVDAFENLLATYPTEKIVDYGEATITPGLIDMHVHVGNVQSYAEGASFEDGLITLMSAWELSRAFSAGITTVRDVGSPKRLGLILKDAQNRGYVEIPRLITTGQGIAISGGHGTPSASVREVNSPWEIRAAIRENFRDGADWIKIMASHRNENAEYTQEELDAAVKEAHRFGKKICVHAGTVSSIEMSIKAGFDTIEHGTFMTVDQAAEMAEKGIFWVPTVIPYAEVFNDLRRMYATQGIDVSEVNEDNIGYHMEKARQNNPNYDSSIFGKEYIEAIGYMGRATEQYKKTLLPYAKMGVKILVGTDMVLSKNPVALAAYEMKCLYQCGLDILTIVQAATANAAYALNLQAKIGQLKKGMIADIAVFKGDGANDINAFAECISTYASGKRVY